MRRNEDLEETQTIPPLDLEEKVEVKKKRTHKKTIVITGTIAAIIAIAGVGGGYAYAANKAYDSYESRIESAKKVDSKLVGKIAEARKLVNATKNTDLIDKTMLDSLNESIKTGESRRGVPDSGNVVKCNLWSISRAKTIVANDITEANDSINAISRAMGKVEASKTAKQVKDAKDVLDKAVKSAEALYKDSEGKVQDDKTRESLKTALSNAEKVIENKKTGVKSLTDANESLSKAVKAVTDSKNAKAQSDAQKQTQEQVQAQQSQIQSAGSSSNGYSGSYYSNTGGTYSSGGSSYSNGGSGSYSGNSSQSYQGSQSQNANNCTQYGCNGYDYRKDFDSAGGGFKPATSDNYLGSDGENDYYEFGGDSQGNMW